MGTSVITAPDGKDYEVSHPDGASDQEILDYAKQNYGGATGDLGVAQGKNAPQPPGSLASLFEPFKRAGAGLYEAAKAVPRGYAEMGKLASQPQELGDILSHPSVIGSAAMEIGKQFAPAVLPTVGAVVGSTVGPAGTVAGAMGGQWANDALEQLFTGKALTPNEVLTRGATTGLMARLGATAPSAVSNAPAALVRNTASSASRMGAGAGMMERLPGRFGVSDDLVDLLYSQARSGGPTPPMGTSPGTTGRALNSVPEGPLALPPIGGTSVQGPPRVFRGEASTLERDLGQPRGAETVLTVPERFGRFTRDLTTRHEVADQRLAGATGPINRGIEGTAEQVPGGVRRQAIIDNATGRVIGYAQEGPLGSQQSFERVLKEAKPQPAAAASPPYRSTGALTNFRSTTEAMASQLEQNPIAAMRDQSTINTLRTWAKEAGAVDAGGGISPRGIDAMIKSINQRIGSTQGAEQGMWKQTLGSLHKDLTKAALDTGNPAFQSFADAISTARLNFLRQDLEEVINRAGIVSQRTGGSVIVSPGKIEQWIKTHPDWAEGVERAKPGLLDSIQKDLADIVPVTRTAAPGIPGGNFGSGRGVLGAAIGHLFQSSLGLSPGMAEALGAVAGFATRRGIHYAPATVERAFAAQPSLQSVFGGATGVGTGSLQDLLSGRR